MNTNLINCRELLNKVIDRLENLQAGTEIRGNSPAGILFETGQFMRILPEVIEELRQVENEMETKKDHGGNHDL